MLQPATSNGLSSNLSHNVMGFRMRTEQAHSVQTNFEPSRTLPHLTPATTENPSQTVEVVAHLFGKFTVAINNTAVAACSSSAGWSTLAYLLANSRAPVPVDVLEGIFWPEASTHAARNNRNVALSHLRQTLRDATPHNLIEHRNGRYQFATNCTLWTDVHEFEQRLATGRWLETNHHIDEAIQRYESALNLYQDDFMVDELYQDWVLRKRDELRNAYIGTLDRLSRLYFGQSNYTACIEAGQRILLRDRWREDVHCMLMRSYMRQGQSCFAVKQFRDCVEALRHEFNMAPSPDTLNLYSRILQREEV